MHKEFRKVDKKKEGWVSQKKLKKFLENLGIFESRIVQDLIYTADPFKNDKITYSEVV